MAASRLESTTAIRPVCITDLVDGPPFIPVTASGTYGPAGAWAIDNQTRINAVDNIVAMGDHALQLNLSFTTAPSALSAQLQGSLDGLNWFNLGSALTGTTSGAQYGTAISQPSRYARLVLTVTGGSGVSITAFYASNE